MANIRLKDIREQYILPALQGKPYRFKVFSNVGAYRRTIEENRIRKGVINALLEVTDSDIILLGGGLKASALNVTLTFLLPLPDEPTDEKSADYGGNYTFAEDFRDMLTETFATTEKITLTGSDGKTYTGGVIATFPLVGEMLQRQIIGNSVDYVCYLQITYLNGGVNASDIQFYLDGDPEPIPYTQFMIARKNNVSAALLSQSSNGESTAYAESSNFAVDLSLPAIDPSSSVTGTAIYNFLLGIDGGNTPHTLRISYNKKNTTKEVIFAETSNEGSGVENVAAKISFIPYMSAENQDA